MKLTDEEYKLLFDAKEEMRNLIRQVQHEHPFERNIAYSKLDAFEMLLKKSLHELELDVCSMSSSQLENLDMSDFKEASDELIKKIVSKSEIINSNKYM